MADGQFGDASNPFGVYVHVPFCRVRCGYCDFNTYTATELGGGASQRDYATVAALEVQLAGQAMRAAGYPGRQVSTVFFGGGTPTLLPASDLVAMLDAIRQQWGIAPGAEVTTEANPDSVDLRYLQELAAGGFTRVSFGMQSAVPHVLATLERTHAPERIGPCVSWARQAGLDVSLDLIYGTPGESLADWRASVRAAIEAGPDHISAYALTVEPGTKLAAQVRRGAVGMPSADDQADKYELADDMLTAAGYCWYEISNWARTDDAADHRCLHNMAYWRGHDWWGVGPGAHSYLGGLSRGDDQDRRGLRWWNVKHPRAYAARVTAGLSPAAGLEWLDPAARELESMMLGIRLRAGMPVQDLPPSARAEIPALIAEGLIDGHAAIAGFLVLTRRGRLLADGVVTRLTRD
nr:radical SAM family heme chaperone HemW [Rarobacter incanus]